MTVSVLQRSPAHPGLSYSLSNHCKYPSAAADLCTEAQDKAIILDLQEQVSLVDVDYFLGPNGLFPPLRSDITGETICGIVEKLKDDRVISELNGHWENLWPGEDTLRHEDDVFRAFPRIVGRIIDASPLQASGSTITFECNPKGITESTTRDNNSKPDCVGWLSSAPADSAKRQWIAVAIAGEFRKKTTATNLNDGYVKVIWSINRLMREDVRRRFVYGFTMEQFTMRLWFASRSDMFVSSAFKITEVSHEFLGHKRLVEFVLRLGYATPEQLGWDETIRRVESTEAHVPVRYDITLNGKTYRTIRLLSEAGAEALRGRGTRVWEVKRLTDDKKEVGEPLVLKDAWIDSSRSPEGAILQAVRDAAKTDWEKWTLDKYCMRTADYGDVLVGGQPDNTFEIMRHGQPYKPTLGTQLCQAAPTERKMMRSTYSVADTATASQRLAEAHLTYGAKVHHRTLFVQVGEKLTVITSLSEVFKYLEHIVVGLEGLHSCKYVHCDISLGNMLIVDGVGKLTDFEYGQHETLRSSQDGVRVGTPFFMATEVEHQQYLHWQPERNEGGKYTKDALNERRRARMRGVRAKTSGGDSVPRHSNKEKTPSQQAHKTPIFDVVFRHNPIHDLESVFWVAVWMLLCSEFVWKPESNVTEEQWKDYHMRHGEYAVKLFCDTRTRDSALAGSSSVFLKGSDVLLPGVQEVLRLLDNLRRLLVTRYRDFETQCFKPGYEPKFSDATPGFVLHANVEDVLAEISGHLAKDDHANDLTVAVTEDPIPVRVIKKALRVQTPDPLAAATSSIPRTRSATATDAEPSPRPPKAQRTAANRTAGMASAPTVMAVRPTRHSARLRAKGATEASTGLSSRRSVPHSPPSSPRA